MATQAEIAVLKGTATEVKNESQVGGNTAARVGGLFEGIVDALPSDEAIDGKISQAVNDIQPIVIEGNVDNAPDQEDLTSVNQGGTDVLKFKDKTYAPALFSGLGRVYLRKNVVTPENLGYAINLLTAEMVAQENTIYRIQYDYDLNGQTITLPAGCVLEFDGGSFSNGTISGDVKIISQNVCFYNIDVTNVSPVIESKWFDFQEGEDCTDLLNNLVNTTADIKFCKYNFPLIVSAPSENDAESQRSCVKFSVNGKSIDFADNTIQMSANSYDNYNILECHANNLNLSNLNVIGDVETHTGETGEFGHGVKIAVAHDVVLENITFSKCWGDGIDIIDRGEDYPYNITLRKVKALNNRRQGISIEAGRNILLEDCEFAGTGSIKATAPTCGVDVEPWHESDAAKIIGLTFLRCSIHDNGGDTEVHLIPCYHFTNAYDSNITFKECEVYNSTLNRVQIHGQNVNGFVIDGCTIGTAAHNGIISISTSTAPIVKNSVLNGGIVFRTTSNFELKDSIIEKGNMTISSHWDGTASYYPIYVIASTGNIKGIHFNDNYGQLLYLEPNGLVTISDSVFIQNVASTSASVRSAQVVFENCVFNFKGTTNLVETGIVTFDGCKIATTASYFLTLYGSHNSNYTYDYNFVETNIESVGSAVVTINTAGKIGYLDQEYPDVVFTTQNIQYTIGRRIKGTTSQRPTLTAEYFGFLFYDESLKTFVTWDGSKWVEQMQVGGFLSKNITTTNWRRIGESEIGVTDVSGMMFCSNIYRSNPPAGALFYFFMSVYGTSSTFTKISGGNVEIASVRILYKRGDVNSPMYIDVKGTANNSGINMNELDGIGKFKMYDAPIIVDDAVPDGYTSVEISLVS